MTEKLVTTAKAKGIVLCTAESCTGGMVAAAITDTPGSSTIFDRGFVTYSNDAKMQMLGVKAATLENHGAVSEEVALEMAQGALKRSNGHVAVAITGIAGPGGSDFKPEGRVCFALAHNKHQSETIEFGAIGRENVRMRATDHALTLLQNAIDSH